MNISVSFEAAELKQLEGMRVTYLSNLRQGQEILLEVMLPSCRCWCIRWRQLDIGYVIVTLERELVEFHLQPEHWVHGQNVIRQAINQLGLTHALVKSFDDLLLSSAIEYQQKVEVLGLLVRDYVPRPLPKIQGIRYARRFANVDDLPAISEIDQQVFSNPERLQQAVTAGWMVLFETVAPKSPALIGFGMLRPVLEGGDLIDVGIAVDAPFRNKGYAVYMLRDLIEECLERGLRPVAGCAAHNLASRRMGERAGFVARYRLLRLTF